MVRILDVFLSILALITCSLEASILLTDQDIQEIYDTYVAINNTPEYKYRYHPLPLEKNNLTWRWENKDFPRVISMLEFQSFIKTHQIFSLKGLAINGLDPEWDYLPHKKILELHYELDPITADLHKLDLPDKDFDFIMVNQTLEHVYNPLLCLENLYKHLKIGGILYFNVPVNNIPHSTPFHYYTGFTPTGLGCLVRSAGFEILSIGQFGNAEYLHWMIKRQGWPEYRDLSEPGINEFNNPVIAWVFAIKN